MEEKQVKQKSKSCGNRFYRVVEPLKLERPLRSLVQRPTNALSLLWTRCRGSPPLFQHGAPSAALQAQRKCSPRPLPAPRRPGAARCVRGGRWAERRGEGDAPEHKRPEKRSKQKALCLLNSEHIGDLCAHLHNSFLSVARKGPFTTQPQPLTMAGHKEMTPFSTPISPFAARKCCFVLLL